MDRYHRPGPQHHGCLLSCLAEVQLKPKHQPYKLGRQWPELLLRFTDATDDDVAMGQCCWGSIFPVWPWVSVAGRGLHLPCVAMDQCHWGRAPSSLWVMMWSWVGVTGVGLHLPGSLPVTPDGELKGHLGGRGLGKARLVRAMNRDALCVYSLVSTPHSGGLSPGIKMRLGHLGQGRVDCVMQGDQALTRASLPR